MLLLGFEPGTSSAARMYNTVHGTCLWHVGGLSNIPQTNYWVAPLVLINKLNYLVEIDCHLLVFYIKTHDSESRGQEAAIICETKFT